MTILITFLFFIIVFNDLAYQSQNQQVFKNINIYKYLCNLKKKSSYHIEILSNHVKFITRHDLDLD